MKSKIGYKLLLAKKSQKITDHDGVSQADDARAVDVFTVS